MWNWDVACSKHAFACSFVPINTWFVCNAALCCGSLHCVLPGARAVHSCATHCACCLCSLWCAGSVLRGNLGILTRVSNAMLNTDTTPATYWVSWRAVSREWSSLPTPRNNLACTPSCWLCAQYLQHLWLRFVLVTHQVYLVMAAAHRRSPTPTTPLRTTWQLVSAGGQQRNALA